MSSENVQHAADEIRERFHRIWQRCHKISDEEKLSIQNEKEADERRLRRESVERLQSDTNAPKRHWDCILDMDGEWGQKLNSLRPRIGSGFMVAFVGTRGNGKTQMAVQLIRDATERLLSARFCTASEFFMAIKSTYKKESSETEFDVVVCYRAPKLLVIDEIGKRSDSEWENTLLFELLNKRYNDMTDTIVIDNRSSAEFQAAIGPSLASRIAESGGIIEFNWPSFRGVKICKELGREP